MRKIPALVAVAVLCGAMVGAAQAGPASIDENGNALIVDAAFDPPTSPPKGFITPVTLEVHTLYGNFRGSPTPTESASISFSMPKGTRVNSRNFPACPLPTEQSQFGDQSRCSSKSLVGSGTVSVDARPSGVQEQLSGPLKVYNGAATNGTPTLMMMTELKVGTGTIRTEINFLVQKGPKLLQFDPLGRPRGETAFSITALDMKLGKNIRSKGETFPFLEAPTTCKKTWAFELGLIRNSSTHTAKDTQPCLKFTR